MTLSGETPAGYESLSGREWLCTNGSGAFASGTVAHVPTRRYHALLIVPTTPPTSGRMTLLSQLQETVTVDGVAFDLHTGRYADGTLHPQGWRYISAFYASPVPTWQYDFPDGLRIIKRVFLAPGANTFYATYARVGGDAVDLTVSPLVCWKDYHQEMHPWNGFPARQGFVKNGYELQATPDAPTLRLLLPGAKWTRAGWWNKQNFHEREAERGQDATEDLYCPASATIRLDKTIESVTFAATLEEAEPEVASLVVGKIVRAATVAQGDAGSKTVQTLRVAAEQFIVRGTGIRTAIVAGYPWFTDWGRDTFISLPGLCLSTKRFDVAREILLGYVPFLSQGMMPNRFPDMGETPEYNTADATLWFVHACGAYKNAVSSDTAFVSEIAPVLQNIVEWHERGTRYGIGVDPADGLLAAGESGTQLTWMDAKVGDYVVTPRRGKPVEINALWIHALRVASAFTGDDDYLTRADRAAASFREKFIRSDKKGLYDCLAPDGSPDPAIRPNQIFAVSLEASLLPDDIAKVVVDTVTQELWTPLGLRSLSPSDPAYRPRYAGSGFDRDTAYHQGTVWAWLVGAYTDARRRTHGDTPDLSILLGQLSGYGMNGIGEIFDGSEPHRADGCPWQAWSVAEVLRVLTNENGATG